MSQTGKPEIDRFRKAAQLFAEQYGAHKWLDPIDERYAPHTVSEAYAVQEVFQTFLAETRGPLCGHKVAITSPAVREMLGLSEPCSGGLFERTVFRSPVTLQGSEYVRLGVEGEIAFRLGKDLLFSETPVDWEEITCFIDSAMAAFEILDFRNPNSLKGTSGILTSIATNLANSAVVLGLPAKDWRDVDLAASRCVLMINGQKVGEGRGGDVMGHPLESFAWLANSLAERGKTLSKGMIVMTGSIFRPIFLSPGDTVGMSVEKLGVVNLKVS